MTRLAYKQSHSVGDRFTGWSIGRKNTLQFGLYDKTFEIEQESGKDYLYEVWEKSGWAPWDTVWRAEGRFRRSVLAQFGLETLGRRPGLPGLPVALLDRNLHSADRAESDGRTRARWPNLGLWDQLSQIAWGMPAGVLTRVYKGLGAPKDRTLAIRAISTLTSLMARDGVWTLAPPGPVSAIRVEYLLTQEIATGLKTRGSACRESPGEGPTLRHAAECLRCACAAAAQGYRRRRRTGELPVVADRPCTPWDSRKPRSFFGCTPRNCVAARRPVRFLAPRWAAPGYFSRRTLPASFVPSIFSGGKRCK